jgi:hypothetical protein
MRLGKTAMAVALVGLAVTIGGCDGPFMMSDEKAKPAHPAAGGAAKGEAAENQGTAGDRMK